MSSPAIKVTGLSKQYYLNALLKSSSILNALKGNGNNSKETFWALKDVSFELQKGDMLGVIGENGSGKSTLLKILSEIVSPTSGTIALKGRVASILEIGTGFHPDLTGRENIFFSGSLLGISSKRLKEKLDEIISFSGIEGFIDTPVKHYSSGMYLRLATAIVFHVDADILLLDEILSAGDAEFKLKTLHKMEGSSGTGATIIMVSHNMNEVMKLCNKCMVLEHGRVASFGHPAQNIAAYINKAVNKNESAAGEGPHTGYTRFWDDPVLAPGDDLVRIKSITARAKGKNLDERIYMQDAILVEIEYWKMQPGMSLEMLIVFYDKMETPVFTTSLLWNQTGEKLYGLYTEETGLFKASCEIPGHLLYKGKYSFQVTFGRDSTHENTHILFQYQDNFNFAVYSDPNLKGEKFLEEMPIALRPYYPWQLTKVALP